MPLKRKSCWLLVWREVWGKAPPDLLEGEENWIPITDLDMTITDQKIEKYYAKFWDIDTQIGGRRVINLHQWKFEVLLHKNNEDEFLKTIKEVEIMDGQSILYEDFSGKAIKTLSEKFGIFATRQIDFTTIVDYEAYYFVAYVIKTNN